MFHTVRSNTFTLNLNFIFVFFRYCGPDHPGTIDPRGNPVAGCGAWIGGLANLWRTSSDLQPHWDSVMSSAGANDVMASVQRVGHYNDPDMLQVRMNPRDVAAASSA